MPLRPSVHLCAFSLWGWIRWTSVSFLWLRRCCSCLSGCFIPLTQRYRSGPEMPVCTGVSVVRNLLMVHPRLSETFLPSLKHTVVVKTSIYVAQFPTCCSSFFFLCPHRISLRIQRLSPHPCVCARVCVYGYLVDNWAVLLSLSLLVFSLLSCVCQYKFPFLFLLFLFELIDRRNTVSLLLLTVTALLIKPTK